MAIDLQAAIAVFDKSADRTRPNAQTEAWAVIRAELMRVMDAPVVVIGNADAYSCWLEKWQGSESGPVHAMKGQRVRLVPADGGE